MKRCAGPSRKRPSAKAKEKLILPQAAGEKKQFLFLSILRSEKTIREKVVPQGRLSASVFLFEGCIKSVSYTHLVKATTDKAVAESQRLFNDIKTDPKLNKAVEDIKKSVSDVSEKVSCCVKSGLDELKNNEDLMEKVDQIKDGTAALVEKGQRAVKDFTSKPEVQQNIEKAKDVTIDVAEKTVDALKNWLRPQPAAEAEPEAKPENEEEKENSAEHEESNNL